MNVLTDVDENTCQFEYSPEMNIQEQLNKLAEENSKIKGFEVISGGH
jgi:hypothetical protein